MNLHDINDVRQIEILTTEQLVLESSCFGVETATEKLKIYKSTGTDKILIELIQAGCNRLRFQIYKHFNSAYNKEEMSEK